MAYCDGTWRAGRGKNHSAVSTAPSQRQSAADHRCFGFLRECYWAELGREGGMHTSTHTNHETPGTCTMTAAEQIQ